MQKMSMVQTNRHDSVKCIYLFIIFFEFLGTLPVKAPRFNMQKIQNMQEMLKMQDMLLVERSLFLSIERIAGTRATHYTVVSPVEQQIGLKRRAAISSLR